MRAPLRTVLLILAATALLCPPGVVAADAPAPDAPKNEGSKKGDVRKSVGKKDGAKKEDTNKLADELFENGLIPRLRITIEKEEWDALSRANREYVAATITESLPGHPDRVYAGVGIHLKGDGGSFRGLNDRPALTLNCDEFVEGLHFHGLDKFHLNNSVQDNSYTHEFLGAWLFNAAGVPAPRVTHARVWLNGRDLGFYVLKESFDKKFLKRHFKNDEGILYEGKLRDIDQDLPTKPSERKNVPCLKSLVEAAKEGDARKRRAMLEQVLDVERFFTFMACENLLAHWDGYGPQRNNYRMYLHPKTNQFTFLPQGLDQLFSNPGYPLVHANALVARALTQEAEDRERLVKRIAELREQTFTPEQLSAQLDLVASRIQPVLEEISPDRAREHKNQVEDLRRRILERVRNVDRQLGMPSVKFPPDGVLAVAKGWEPKVEGNFKAEQVSLEDKPVLYLKAESGGTSSWRMTLDLPQGKYAFEGKVRTKDVQAPDGNNAAAGLRISGGQRQSRVAGDSDWQTVSFDFDVPEATRAVVLVCELRANKGEAWFDLESLKIRKR